MSHGHVALTSCPRTANQNNPTCCPRIFPYRMRPLDDDMQVFSPLAYHTIVLYSIDMCEGFETHVSSKPSFFAHRTLALYASPVYERLFARSYSLKKWIGLWTRIVSKLPSLRYLEAYSSQSFAPAIVSVKRVNDLLSKSFPAVTHLMFLVDPASTEQLAQSFTKLKVFIVIIVEENPPVENPWIRTLQARYPNVVAHFWAWNALGTVPGPDQLESFKREVNGESASIWAKAEQEIALKIELQ
ncbi:hypothetical protein DL96DRAFT_1714723 [Flagelloscypha sp. PMI_526]|nr:hypothetical protein DL96DRAFT_1714723 [Flagelloscypha sp. PMI_526]